MSFIAKLLFQIPVLLLSLTIHEYSHGYVAYILGDDTAKRAGRLTLNPLPHIDPIGLLMLFIVHIGWAKPVPINPYNFKDQKKGSAITAAAGPISNFMLAITLAIIFNLIKPSSLELNPLSSFNQFILGILFYAILINLALGLFNLIPFPPLDGSKIIGGFMSDEAYYRYTAREKQGAQILLIIFVVSYIFNLNLIGSVIIPPLNFFLNLLTGVTI